MLVFLTSGALFAQSNKTKLISKKWIVNKEAMRPVITKMILDDPTVAELDNDMKLQTVKNAIHIISKLRIELSTQGTIITRSTKGVDTGTWKFSRDETKLYTQSSDGKIKEQFIVQTLNNSKLVLATPNNVQLIFRRQ